MNFALLSAPRVAFLRLAPRFRAALRLRRSSYAGMRSEEEPPPLTKEDSLVNAVMNGDADAVAQMLAEGADPDCSRFFGFAQMSPLCIACVLGDVKIVTALLDADVDVGMQHDEIGIQSPLSAASLNGHAAILELLLERGAPVDDPDAKGYTALHLCCANGHAKCARMLLSAGSYVDREALDGCTPFWLAFSWGRLECVQVVSAWGAARVFPREQVGRPLQVSQEVQAWLAVSRGWGPLHHLEVNLADRTLQLLRGTGESLHSGGAASPLSLARALQRRGLAPKGSSADLVLRAAEPWSPSTHHLFPARARARASLLVRQGWLLSRTPPFHSQAQALVDVFRELVLPHAISREEGE